MPRHGNRTEMQLAPEDKRASALPSSAVTSILLNLTVGVFILLWPEAFASFLNQPDPIPKTWPRHWGAQLLAINMLYMPGYWDPSCPPLAQLAWIVIRLSFGLFFFSQGDGFMPMGIYDGASRVALLVMHLASAGMPERPGEDLPHALGFWAFQDVCPQHVSPCVGWSFSITCPHRFPERPQGMDRLSRPLA